jgi:hypothetical protein
LGESAALECGRLAIFRKNPSLYFLDIRQFWPKPRHIAPRYWLQRSNRIRKELGMKKERRWLKSAIAASAEPQITLPWARGQRRRPEAMKSAEAPKSRAIAAR